MTVLRLTSVFDILGYKFCCICQGVNVVPEDFVGEQLKSVLSDMQVDVVS